MRICAKNLLNCFVLVVSVLACVEEDNVNQKLPNPSDPIYYLPVVIHVLHNGESIGQGPNLAEETIKRQIEILNEDFRKKEGTRGFNDHPDGGDSRIEFVLAKQDPDGRPTSGIVRINVTSYNVPNLGYNQITLLSIAFGTRITISIYGLLLSAKTLIAWYWDNPVYLKLIYLGLKGKFPQQEMQKAS